MAYRARLVIHVAAFGHLLLCLRCRSKWSLRRTLGLAASAIRDIRDRDLPGDKGLSQSQETLSTDCCFSAASLSIVFSRSRSKKNVRTTLTARERKLSARLSDMCILLMVQTCARGSS